MEFLALIETEIKKTKKLLHNPALDMDRVKDWFQVLEAMEEMWRSQYILVKERGLL